MSDAKIVLSAQDQTRGAFASLRGSISAAEAQAASLGAAFGGVGRLVGTAFAGVTLTAFVRQTIDGIDALNDLKDATGASIENISALEDVARRTGTSFDVVGQALVKFNQVLGNTSPDQANVFKALGLDLERLKQLDPAEALRQTAVAISQFASDGERARAVQELLGKSVRDLAPFLNDLADKGQLVATVTTEQAEQAEALNKQFFELSKNATDFARALVSDVVPAVSAFLAQINGISRAGGLFSSIGKEFRAEVVGDELTRVVKQIEDLQATMDRQGADAYLERRMRNLRAEASALSRESAELTGWLKRFADAANPALASAKAVGEAAAKPKLKLPALDTGPDKGAARVTPKPETIDQSAAAMQRYVDVLRERVALGGEATELEKTLYAINKAGLLASDNALAAEALSLASMLDQRKAITDEIQASARADEEAARRLRAIDDQLEEFSGRTVEALRQAQLARLQARQAAGEIFTPEELQKIYAGIYGIKEATERTIDQSNTILEKFSDNVQDALGQTVLATLEGSYSNILKLWGNLVKRLIAEAIAADLTKALFGDLVKGNGGNTNALLGQLFKLAVGAFAGGGGSGMPDDVPTRGGRAGGGRVDKGGMYEVNELGGPGELFRTKGRDYLLAASDGVIIPSGERGASGAGSSAGAVTVQLVNNGKPMEVEQTSQQQTSSGTLISVVVREIKADILRGGGVGQAIGSTFGLNRAAGAPRRG